MTVALQAVAQSLPGWYGKLPGMGDFAHRRLPSSFLRVWDAWLQQGFHELRTTQPDWTRHFLDSSIWFFTLGRNVVDSNQWMGVLMPSVDSAGRYFPLTLATELNEAALEVSAERASGFLHWWTASANLAVAGLDQDMDANQFEAMLGREFLQHAQPSISTPSTVNVCASGESAWIKQPPKSHLSDLLLVGLPTGSTFNALFDCAAICDRDTDEASA